MSELTCVCTLVPRSRGAAPACCQYPLHPGGPQPHCFSPRPSAAPLVIPVALAHRLAALLEELPLGVSLSHTKLACALKACVLISWAQRCLLVAVLLLMSLMRTTWAVGCWPWMARSGALSNMGLLVPRPVSWLSCFLRGLRLPIPSPQLPFWLEQRLPTLGNAHDSGLVVSHVWGASPGLAAAGMVTGRGV